MLSVMYKSFSFSAFDARHQQTLKKGEEKGRMSEAKLAKRIFPFFYIFFDINFPFSRLRNTFSRCYLNFNVNVLKWGNLYVSPMPFHMLYTRCKNEEIKIKMKIKEL